MLLVLLAASISRCASPAACPLDGELIAAITARNNEDAIALEQALWDQDPGSDHAVSRAPVLGVEQVHCSDVWQREPRQLSCSFTIFYPETIVFQVARLSSEGGRWTIEDAMSVTRDRRGAR